MTNKNINIVFMGTPEFSVPSLERINEEFGVRAVVTVPDKPQGRGQKLQPSPVKLKAIELKIPVLQPESLKDENFIKELQSYEPDIIVVIAFKILPAAVYKSAKIASFNVHASLLPKYRGAAPINWAIINGEKITGLTTFILQDKVDTGDMLLQRKINIPENATAGDLYNLMMPLAADLAVETCQLLISGNYTPIKQDDSLASPAPKIFPEQCKIDWNQDAKKLKNFIHGVSPDPGAWTIFDGKRLKILRCIASEMKNDEAGTFAIVENKFLINCSSGSINIIELQIEGKKVMNIKDFLNGYRGDKQGRLL